MEKRSPQLLFDDEKYLIFPLVGRIKPISDNQLTFLTFTDEKREINDPIQLMNNDLDKHIRQKLTIEESNVSATRHLGAIVKRN